jgi:alpha-amylase
MMEWSLPTKKAILKYESFTHELSEDKDKWETFGQFVRGGFWRNFFVKYPESDHLHKRILGLSERFASLRPSVKKTEKWKNGYDLLLAAQCNDTYWHGVFGGIYLANLRHEVYTNLIRAENELCELETKSELRMHDSVLENKFLRITVDSLHGGAISEIDYKPKAFNLSNFINRYDEPSHEKLKSAKEAGSVIGESKSIHDQILTKERGLEKYLVIDWYRHGSFIEHFLSDEATIDDVKKMTFLEHGDFFKSPFTSEVQKDRNTMVLKLERQGTVFANGSLHQFTVRKSLVVNKGSENIFAHLAIQNNSDVTIPVKFASEWTFGLLAGDAEDRYYESPGVRIADRKLNSTGIFENAQELSLVDEWSKFKITLKTKRICTFWRTPIETVSLSEEGFERIYQGSMIFAVWNFSLSPGEIWDVDLYINVMSL